MAHTKSIHRFLGTLALMALLPGGSPTRADRALTFDDRVKAQEAVERVYYRHQIGATRPFEEAVPREVLERKVRNALAQTSALETLWGTAITEDSLSREVERMVAGTRMPERLRELFAALHDDPSLIRECLARTTLADRLARDFFAYDQRIHGATRDQATSLRASLVGAAGRGQEAPRSIVDVVRLSPGSSPNPSVRRPDEFELPADEFDRLRAELPAAVGEIGAVAEARDAFKVRVILSEDSGRLRLATYVVPKKTWDDWWKEVSPALRSDAVPVTPFVDAPLPKTVAAFLSGEAPVSAFGAGALSPTSSLEPPSKRERHSAVWTGSAMLVWGGRDDALALDTGSRYDPITGTWTPISTANAPTARFVHTAVWTGNRMVVWGGRDVAGNLFDTGGRYDPVSDTWAPTSTLNAPIARRQHTAVWTGTEMIVWGGLTSNVDYLGSGACYDPEGDVWRTASSIDAPEARSGHTVVWTGSEMIVWGGTAYRDGSYTRLRTGGRYDPGRDTWTATSTVNAPVERHIHNAVWSGNVMVVWGGLGGSRDEPVNTGGRYDPATDSWNATTTLDAPAARFNAKAVWTGSRMIVWGGNVPGASLDTGGQYDPVADGWTATSILHAPSPRNNHTQVWTGRFMVVWGGRDTQSVFDTGSRYDPATDSWSGMSGKVLCDSDDTWDNGSLADRAPDPRAITSAVWTGTVMVVWGGRNNWDATLNTGGRYDPMTDTWTATSTVNAPSARRLHRAIWTGDVMVVWGGYDDIDYLNTGGRYDPVADTWRSISTTGAPSGRSGFVSVWSGGEMVVWGGVNRSGRMNTGGRYDPATDRWTATSTAGAPDARNSASGVWTGSEMVVWGGVNTALQDLNTGGRYDPATDQWRPVATSGAPSARRLHTAVWTGSVMVVWGGYNAGSTGGRYDPWTDTWTPTATLDAPDGRYQHTAVWTGSEMVVWGGADPLNQDLASGARYDPITDRWLPTSSVNAPPERRQHVAVWSEGAMIVWGGSWVSGGITDYRDTGGRYDPATDRWTPTATTSGPVARSGHTAVWTGNVMIVQGGWGASYYEYRNDGGRYDPATDSWSPTAVAGAPTPRSGHTAVWTGTEMIIWGGLSGDPSGGRYDPIGDSWTPTTMSGAPEARNGHSAVWTGTEMLVWGGYNGVSSSLNTGARYDPLADRWTATSVENAPEGRDGHTAVWTGESMVIWGGSGYSWYLNTGGRYDPAGDTWRATTTESAPSPRTHHTAVWTGARMVVVGGNSVDAAGARYDPSTDTWVPNSSHGAPEYRTYHSAIWTGNEVVVWGGTHDANQYLFDGGRYNPSADTWTPVSTSGAATGRYGHTAVWTGSLMIVWGGVDAHGALGTGGRYALGHTLDADGDGFTECQGDCNDADPSIYPGALEICNGRDDDCDGLVDEAASGPPAVPRMIFTSFDTLTWAPASAGLFYDVVRGDLALLQASAGDFTSSLQTCVVDDTPQRTALDVSVPPPNDGYYYLVRAVGCGQNGTYDSAAPAQQGSRDGEIAESLAACP